MNLYTNHTSELKPKFLDELHYRYQLNKTDFLVNHVKYFTEVLAEDGY
jgi:thermostable 8-oxoguanine DNA glycosylase